MKFDGYKKSGKSHEQLPRRARDKAAESFAQSLAERVSVRTHGTIALIQRSFRSQVFSSEIAGRRSEVYGAVPLRFLATHFGNRFASTQTRGVSGERVYKHPGNFFRHTSYNSLTKLCMSFNFNQLARSVQILLNQLRATQIFASAGYTTIESMAASSSRERAELPQATKLTVVTQWSKAMQQPEAMPGSGTMQWPPPMRLPQPIRRAETVKLPPVRQSSAAMQWPAMMQSLQAIQWPRAVRPQPVMQWSPTMQLLQSVQQLQALHAQQTLLFRQSMQLPHSLLLRPVAQSAREVVVRFPASQTTKPGEMEAYAVDRLFTLTKLKRWDTGQTQVRERDADRILAMIANVPVQTLVQTTYLRYLGDKSLQPHGSLRFSPMSVSRAAGERRLHAAARQQDASDPTVAFGEQRTAANIRLAFEKRTDLLRFKQIHASPRALDAGFAFIPSTISRSLAKRASWLTERSKFETKLFETELFKTKWLESKGLKPSLAPLTAEAARNLLPASKLILLRREPTAPAPSMDFIFAQATRQKISEERVVKHLEQREIVELVRKEVKQSMTRVSPLRDFTREDYVEISDHVYSTLMKRLTAEQERLGLR